MPANGRLPTSARISPGIARSDVTEDRSRPQLLSLGHNQWCAFEVDEVQGPFDWESVVAKGHFSPHGGVRASWDLDRALAALRTIAPETLGAHDPTPERDVVFGIHGVEITGRSSVTAR